MVTRSDGKQSVQIIKNDLGLRAADKSGMISRLQAQGLEVTGISTFDGMDDRSPAGKEAASIVARLRNKAEVNRAARSPERQRQPPLSSQPTEIPQVPLSASALDIGTPTHSYLRSLITFTLSTRICALHTLTHDIGLPNMA